VKLNNCVPFCIFCIFVFLYFCSLERNSPACAVVHDLSFPNQMTETGDDGHEQLILNGGRFNPAFFERDKKQTIIDLRGISTNWFKNQFCPSKGFLGYGLRED
jgi:hypothetical protein